MFQSPNIVERSGVPKLERPNSTTCSLLSFKVTKGKPAVHGRQLDPFDNLFVGVSYIKLQPGLDFLTRTIWFATSSPDSLAWLECPSFLWGPPKTLGLSPWTPHPLKCLFVKRVAKFGLPSPSPSQPETHLPPRVFPI